MKTHWKDIHIDNSTNLKKSPEKGRFFSPKNPRGTWTRVLPGSSIYILHKEPLPLCFDQVLEKYNGWIKSYRVKTVILTILGAFWPLLAPLRTRNLTESRQTVHFQVLKHLNLSSALWKTTRKTYILTFCNFEKNTPKRGVLSPKKPRGTWTRVLPGSAIYILHGEPLPPCFD